MRFSTFFALLACAIYAPAQVLTASKILSGSGTDVASAIAVDSQGNVFIAGTTTSPDFPIVNGLITRVPDTALRSSTDGKAFLRSALATPNVTAIAPSSDGHTILAADVGSIYRSADGGVTWNATPATISGNVVALAIDPVNPTNAYAVASLNGSTVFYHSADGGTTWQSNGAVGAPQGTPVSRILIDPQNPTSIYALFSNGLYHSTDSGNGWQPAVLPLANPNVVPTAFAFAPSQPQTQYVVVNFGPGLKSIDGGATWQTIASLNTINVNTFAVDPQNPDVFWFTNSMSVYRSVDGGASVQLVAQLGNGTWQSIAIDPANSSHIFAADTSNIYASLDDGATWNVAATGQFSSVVATPLAIYAAGGVPPTLFLAKLDSTLTQVLFSTFIGPVEQRGIAIALDTAGNALVTGLTQWPDFPTTGNALQGVLTSNLPGFAVKVRGDGGALLYSTFLNGLSPSGAAFDSSGNAVIVGAAQPEFAVTRNAYQTTIPGPCTRPSLPLNVIPPLQSGHAYAAKLSGDGRSLLYATYFSGSCGDTANAVLLDSVGNAYITGFTYSVDFPLTPNATIAAFPKSAKTAGFVSELSADGSSLLYSSFFGGGENNSGSAIALDGHGNVYVAGYTQATASPGALAVANPNGCEYIINIGPSVDESYEYIDGFVMKMTLSGAPPAFLATIGGSCQDSVQSLALDGAGDIWVSGTTASADFPLRAPIAALGLPLVTVGAGESGFVAEVDPTGSSLEFSAFTGGANISAGVAASRAGAYVASATAAPSKLGATFAIAAFIDGSQSPPIAIDSIQAASAPGFATLPELPFFTAPAVAPGELVVLNGRRIGPTTAVNAQLPPGGAFPGTLSGAQVSFNGIPAPLISIQANRIECQAPFELDGAASVEIQVVYNGQTSNSFPGAVVTQQVSVLAVANADGTANSASNPAQIGSTVTIYLTGLGQTVPAGIDGALNASAAIVPRTLPTVYGGGGVVQPLFLGAAPGESTGVFQMNFLAPAPDAGPGAASYSIVGNMLPYLAGVTVYVK
jgi:uncharacterized protein (TIGR03437 family)